ncbi:MAG: hypothetical protein R3C05_10335 [Pirellulaceae bacterium]
MLKRRKWTFLILAVLAFCLATHSLVLSWITRPFIHRVPLDTSRVTHLLMRDGDRLLETTLSELRPGRKLLLVRESPSRSEQCGAVPSEDQLLPELLSTRGVGPDQLEWLPGTLEDGESVLRPLEDWLNAHPNVVLCVFVEALGSGPLRRRIDRRYAVANARRVIIYPLEPEDYRSDRWWRSRSGCKDFFGQLVQVIVRWSDEESEIANPYPTPQAYEDAFKERLKSFDVSVKSESPTLEVSL